MEARGDSAIMAAAFALLSGCHSSGLPKPATKAYTDEVTAFYVGLAALQVGDDVRADSTLERATQLAPRRAGRLGKLGRAGVAPGKL